MASKTKLPSSTGAGYWPAATPFRVQAPSLTETLEAEFNIAQMRVLARTWDVKLKGASRHGFVEQVAAALLERVARMRETPEALLEGLNDEQARFARRLFTARDHELPIPRTLAAAIWAGHRAGEDGSGERASSAGIAEMFDSLRRRALVFPTHRYVGYRDVYYQWLPLSASGGNVPMLQWETGDGRQAAGDRRVVFLDAFDLFLDAVVSTGVDTRPALSGHPQADTTLWLRSWEYGAESVQRLLSSRTGWAPDPRSGIGVPLASPLSVEATDKLVNQTGLPAPECEFLFAVAAALQLIEAPDSFVVHPANASGRRPSGNCNLGAGWHLNARLSAVEEWFALTHEERLLRAWTAWQERAAEGIEAAHAMHSDCQVMRAIGARELGPLDLAAEWCALRRYVVRAVRGLPAGVWISWPEFRRALYDLYPECAWALFSMDQWWFADARLGVRLDPARYEDWSRSAGAVIEYILRESLNWFGAVEIDASAGELQSLRVSPLADWLWRAQVAVAAATPGARSTLPDLPAQAAPRPRQVAPVVWLDDRRWRLPPAPDRAEFIAFARKIGQPCGADGGEADGAVFTYSLTPASIERALAEGITLPETAAYFERFGAPMPEAAQALFQSIATRFGRVRVYEALTVLQVSDDYALTELMANTSLGQAVIHHISKRAVVVRPEALDDLMREMVERGYTPSVR